MHPATWKINSLTLVGAFHCFGLVRRSPGIPSPLLPCAAACQPTPPPWIYSYTPWWSSRTLFHQGHRRTSRTAAQNVRLRLEISRSCSWHPASVNSDVGKLSANGKILSTTFERTVSPLECAFLSLYAWKTRLREDRCRCVYVYVYTHVRSIAFESLVYYIPRGLIIENNTRSFEVKKKKNICCMSSLLTLLHTMRTNGMFNLWELLCYDKEHCENVFFNSSSMARVEEDAIVCFIVSSLILFPALSMAFGLNWTSFQPLLIHTNCFMILCKLRIARLHALASTKVLVVIFVFSEVYNSLNDVVATPAFSTICLAIKLRSDTIYVYPELSGTAIVHNFSFFDNYRDLLVNLLSLYDFC